MFCVYGEIILWRVGRVSGLTVIVSIGDDKTKGVNLSFDSVSLTNAHPELYGVESLKYDMLLNGKTDDIVGGKVLLSVHTLTLGVAISVYSKIHATNNVTTGISLICPVIKDIINRRVP